MSVYFDIQLNLFENNSEEESVCLSSGLDEKIKTKRKQVIGELEENVLIYQKSNSNDIFIKILMKFKSSFERIASQKRDEDLIQELSEVLWNATKNYNVEAGVKFKTFFWTCVHNHIGTKKIRKSAQKRSGSQKIQVKRINETTGEEELVDDIYVPPVVSLQSNILSSENSDTELGELIESKMFKKQYIDIDFIVCLEDFFNSGLLKENEKKAIKMIIDGDTLFDIGQALGGKTASAIHFMLRRLKDKRSVREYLLKMLK